MIELQLMAVFFLALSLVALRKSRAKKVYSPFSRVMIPGNLPYMLSKQAH